MTKKIEITIIFTDNTEKTFRVEDAYQKRDMFWVTNIADTHIHLAFNTNTIKEIKYIQSLNNNE